MIDTKPRLSTAEDLLDQLLGGTLEELDIPGELAQRARQRYTEVGTFLNQYGDSRGTSAWDVFAQGSFRLNTVVKPVTPTGDFDIDLVCVRMISKESTTQERLKIEVGQALDQYARSPGNGTTACRENGRCWTLTYPDLRLHMDVLPSIPDTASRPSGILLADRDYPRWLASDPIRYATWFRDRMKTELMRKQAQLAEKRRSTIDQIPDYDVKTTLQRAVQALKRHRDLFFKDALESRPASILITTLAAHAYKGEQNLYEAVAMMAETMEMHVVRDGAQWCVVNPVQPQENFADHWQTNPELHRVFQRWLASLRQDLAEVREQRGLPLVVERLARGFGSEVMKSAERLGSRYLGTRDAGGLAMAASGILSTTSENSLRVRNHGFYGDEDSTK
jgi:hypothetical protein